MNEKQDWEIQLSFLLKKLIGWRESNVDIELRKFISKTLSSERKRIREKIDGLPINRMPRFLYVGDSRYILVDTIDRGRRLRCE